MRKVYPLLLLLVAVVFSAAVYGELPEQMPVHWNLRGEVDRYGGPLEGVLLMPLMAIAIWGFMRVLPKIDPRKANFERFRDTYEFVINGVMTILLVMHVVLLCAAMGWPIPTNRVVPALFGVMLIGIGNVFPRSRSNWLFGVRTPWTLSSDRVWARTHRVAGYLFVVAGLAFLLYAALPGPLTIGIALAVTATAIVGSVLYSYVAWRKERTS